MGKHKLGEEKIKFRNQCKDSNEEVYLKVKTLFFFLIVFSVSIQKKPFLFCMSCTSCLFG